MNGSFARCSSRIYLICIIVSLALPASSFAGSIDSLLLPFTLTVTSGNPEKLFDGTAEVSYEKNAFGVSELGFKGIVGLQVEPTSAFRHHSLDNISRGDIFFVKCSDSTIYQADVLALRADAIELSFKPVTAEFAGRSREVQHTYPRSFTVMAGAAFPTDWLAATKYDDPRSGYASTGISVGIEYMHGISENFDVGISGVYSHLPLDNTTLYAQVLYYEPASELNFNSWDLLWFMPEVGYRAQVLPVMTLYIHGMGGLLGGYAPEITKTVSGGKKVTLKSGSTLTYCYGAAIGIMESERVNVSVRYMAGEGNYSKINTTSHFATNTIQFMVGYIF